MINPLIHPFNLPPFSSIKPEHMVPAITEILINYRVLVKSLLKNNVKYTWDNLVQPLDEAEEYLHRILSPIRHLHSVKNNCEIREAYKKVLSLISAHNAWLGQNKDLYRAYYSIKKHYDFSTLNISQKKSINNCLQNFKLSGVELSYEKKNRYTKIVTRLSELSNIYSNNVLDSTMGWSKLITNKQELLGIPESVLQLTKAKARSKNCSGWLITLDAPIYLPVITYCENALLRKEIYYAYITRASDQGPNAGIWDNSKIMDEILLLRYELAKLLGFNSYIEKSLSTKMVKSSTEVFNFLKKLLKHTRMQAKQELSELKNFIKNQYNITTLTAWDINYYSQKQKKYLYNIDDEQLRAYFTENQVILGLFEVVKRIYGLIVKERHDIDVYHPTVKFFDVYKDNNKYCGSFYLDLYAREEKCSGAWMDECTVKIRKSNGSIQKPVAYLVCNFNAPIPGTSATLTHNEVITLFHEFGHVLHHILTDIEVLGVSGIHGVLWDAVELPSQFMENWCWEPEALSFISKHHTTKESLPLDLLDKTLKTKNYQSALFIVYQIELSLFDLYLHIERNPDNTPQILDIFHKVKRQVSVVPSRSWNRFPHSFHHIFSGEYAAGYYSYLWSDVMAADAYARFKEEGIFNPVTGQSFLINILMSGGSEEPMELFKKFRGRAPNIAAMLKNYEIKNNVI